jgi:hypothetical protein
MSRSRYKVRKCDKELKKFGIRFFSFNLDGMKKLSERGIRLKSILESKGIEVIETYPGAFYDMIGLPRPKSKNMAKHVLKVLIEAFRLNYNKRSFSLHELDSIVCALVGKFYLEGKFISLGDPKEGLLILPKPELSVL